MKDSPILFTASNVLAIQFDLKDTTRRLMKNIDFYGCPTGDCPHLYERECREAMNQPDILGDCPHGGPGDRLWVRENLKLAAGVFWVYSADNKPVMVDKIHETEMIVWAHHKQQDYCPSIHMPRWASRLTLELVEVRAERLQDITEEGAMAEGIWREWKPPLLDVEPALCMPGFYTYYCGTKEDKKGGFDTAKQCFESLWNSIHKADGPNGWNANPYVWVEKFKKVEAISQ